MSELPKLTPVTRRVPPAGYKKPDYSSMVPSEAECADAWDADLSTVQEAEQERYAKALATTSRTLATYRWWGFTNLINNLRLLIQLIRFRIANRH